MTTASDPMARVFNSMAGVFQGCSFWMTALSDCVAGGVIVWSQDILAVGTERVG